MQRVIHLCTCFETLQKTIVWSHVYFITMLGLVECMSCKGVPEPHDCKETIICAEHEVIIIR